MMVIYENRIPRPSRRFALRRTHVGHVINPNGDHINIFIRWEYYTVHYDRATEKFIYTPERPMPTGFVARAEEPNYD